MLAGPGALSHRDHPLYLPDDYTFHSSGNEEQYALGSYFGSATFGLLDSEAQRTRMLEVTSAACPDFVVQSQGTYHTC